MDKEKKSMKLEAYDHRLDQIKRREALQVKLGKNRAVTFRQLFDLGLELLEAKEVPEEGYSVKVYQVKEEHIELVRKFALELDMSESDVIQLCIEKQLKEDGEA